MHNYSARPLDVAVQNRAGEALGRPKNRLPLAAGGGDTKKGGNEMILRIGSAPCKV